MSFAEMVQTPLRELPNDILLWLRDRIAKELTRRGKAGEYSPPEDRRAGSANIYRKLARETRQPSSEKPTYRRIQNDLRAYLPEDWDYLFNGQYDEEPRYYVYCHVNPKKKHIYYMDGNAPIDLKGTPFYVGKGTSNRAWDLNRNEGHGLEIRNLRNRGIADGEIVNIVRDGLTEKQALVLESKLIYIFGSRFDGLNQGFLLNLEQPPRPYA